MGKQQGTPHEIEARESSRLDMRRVPHHMDRDMVKPPKVKQQACPWLTLREAHTLCTHTWHTGQAV